MEKRKVDLIFSILFQIITLALVIAFIVMLYQSCRYIGHAWDDYSYSWMGKVKGALGTALDQYKWWNGRLFSNFSLALLYRSVNLEAQINYSWIFFLMTFLTMPALLLKKLKLPIIDLILLAMVLGVAWILVFPSQAGGISWNTGTFNYLLPFLIALASSYGLLTIRNRWYLLTTCTLYLSLLSAEVIPFLFFTLFISLLFSPSREWRLRALIGIFITLIAFTTIISSPGYDRHQAIYGYTAAHNFFFSSVQTGFNIIHLLMEPTLLFPLCTGLLLVLILGKRKILKREHGIPAMALLTFSLVIFSTYWNQGNQPPPRILNTLFAALFIPLSYYCWGLLSLIRPLDKVQSHDRALLYTIFLLIIALLSTWPTRFYGQRLSELYNTGRSPILKDYWQYRQEMLSFLKDNPNRKITYPKFYRESTAVPYGLHHSQEGEAEAWIRYSLLRNYKLLELKWGGDIPRAE